MFWCDVGQCVVQHTADFRAPVANGIRTKGEAQVTDGADSGAVSLCG